MNTAIRRIIGCLCLLFALLLLLHAFTKSTTAPAALGGPARTTPSIIKPCAAPLHTGSTEATIAQTVFDALNQSRKENGVSALEWCNALANSARQHDLAMQKADVLAHQLPGEADLGIRENRQGITWTEAGENIGYISGLLDAQGALLLHQAMMAEKPPDDGHRRNILEPVRDSSSSE